MFSGSKLPVLSLLLCAVLAPASRADGFGFSFSKGSKNGAFSVGYSSGPSAPRAYRSHYRHARWVPGHYESVRERVWVPGSVQRVWIEPRYGWRRDSHGRAYRGCLSKGHYAMVEQPGRFEYCERQVWVDGCWRTR